MLHTSLCPLTLDIDVSNEKTTHAENISYHSKLSLSETYEALIIMVLETARERCWHGFESWEVPIGDGSVSSRAFFCRLHVALKGLTKSSR